MSNRIQSRRDTAANWTALDPVLASGELGLEVDTFKVKFGNGLVPWSELPYIAGAGGGGGGGTDPATEGLIVHNGTTGGGTRPTGYFRVRWVSPPGSNHSRPTNMAIGDVWEKVV